MRYPIHIALALVLANFSSIYCQEKTKESTPCPCDPKSQQGFLMATGKTIPGGTVSYGLSYFVFPQVYYAPIERLQFGWLWLLPYLDYSPDRPSLEMVFSGKYQLLSNRGALKALSLRAEYISTGQQNTFCIWACDKSYNSWNNALYNIPFRRQTPGVLSLGLATSWGNESLQFHFSATRWSFPPYDVGFPSSMGIAELGGEYPLGRISESIAWKFATETRLSYAGRGVKFVSAFAGFRFHGSSMSVDIAWYGWSHYSDYYWVVSRGSGLPLISVHFLH